MTGRRLLAFFAALVLAALPLSGSGAQRVVIIKADGVPADLLDSLVRQRNSLTGKSTLPWIDSVFYQHGARVANFYTRGISLSAPAWSLLDTGRHLLIRGNVEYDRYTFQVYDYLNFFPFYLKYALSRRVDMPGVEVLEQSGAPLLIDRFPYQEQYQSFQLLQKGVRWKTLQHGLQGQFAGRGVRELMDEWQAGLKLSDSLSAQTERELIARLQDPKVRYLDFFTGDFDHVAHAVRDRSSQRHALEELDALVGRLWAAIQKTPAAAGTALVLVSDHGMNSDPSVYSQGYSLLDWFRSIPGGAQHVVTNRHPLSDYSLKGLDPFVSRVVTAADWHPYLSDQAEQYPTVLLDLDGNERASIHFRNNDLNQLHILLRQVGRRDLPAELRPPAVRAIHRIINSHREEWTATVSSLHEELSAVRRALDRLRESVALQPKKWTTAEREQGVDKEARRLGALLDDWQRAEHAYSAYAGSLEALMNFRCDRCQPTLESIAQWIPPKAMGDRNTLPQLRHYITGPASTGLRIGRDGELDLESSFRHIDHFAALRSITVRNVVQAGVSASPLDFLAIRIPREQLAAGLPDGQPPTEDAVFLYEGEEQQALLLRREVPGTEPQIRYLPMRHLRDGAGGKLRWDEQAWQAGLPLALWEDPMLAVDTAQKDLWLSGWHTEREWLRSIHQTRYSNAVIGLLEHFGPVRVGTVEAPAGTSETDRLLLTRWQQRRRALVEPDLVAFANNHWNFNVRGFNPGGNHGAFFRSSTHAVLLLAGAGIPTQAITEPYDSLNFFPTLAALFGWSPAGQAGTPIPLGL